MSHSSIWCIYDHHTDKVRKHKKFSNGHGTASMLWNFLCQQYLNVDSWMLLSPNICGGFNADEYDRLWKLIYAHDVPEHQRLILAWTLDYGMCPVDKLPELASACVRTHSDIITKSKFTWSHWPAIGPELIRISTIKGVTGVGLGCTSVSDPWEKEEDAVITKIWDIFDEIKKESN